MDVEFQGQTITAEDIDWPLVPLVHGCTSFDPNKYFEFDPKGELFFRIRSSKSTYRNYEINVYIEDAATTTSRLLKSNAKKHIGADIKQVGLSMQFVKKYLLTFTRNKLTSIFSCKSDSRVSTVHLFVRLFVTLV